MDEIEANSRRYLTFVGIDWDADNDDIIDLIDSLPESPTKEQFDACFDAIAGRRKSAAGGTEGANAGGKRSDD